MFFEIVCYSACPSISRKLKLLKTEFSSVTFRRDEFHRNSRLELPLPTWAEEQTLKPTVIKIETLPIASSE